MQWKGLMEARTMSTIHDSIDSRVLGWGALAVIALLLAAFLMAARPAMTPLGDSVPPPHTAQTQAQHG
jgi:hypothetical protein